MPAAACCRDEKKSEKSRDRGLRRCGSTVRCRTSRKKQVSRRTNRAAGSQGRFLGLRGDRVQKSRGGKSGGLRQPRIQRGHNNLRVGLGQTNMNGPGGFQRPASKAGVAFHVADDERPGCSCPQWRDMETPDKHKTAISRRLTDQLQRTARVIRHASRNRFFVIPQYLCNLLRDFLGRICFSFPTLHIKLILCL